MLYFVLISLFLQSCYLIFSGDKKLGGGYYWTNDRGFSQIIMTSTPTYDGVGLFLIPPTVTKVDFNRKYIIALSEDLYTQEKKYYIINKQTAYSVQYRIKNDISWESIKWKNVDGPLDSVAFFQILKKRSISLRFDDE